ncbi:MAG TPA: single-stranded DNA-binding protein [Firmicutes bacterium]|jgi:single-strand DNA-binding protein|nr:single-stranded DNA-binding protein [Bacillota bacterium]
MLNKVILIGRLVRDPELRYTPTEGVAVANFTLAVDRSYVNQKGEREADFIKIVTWRKLAETCANNLSKGRLVAVDGQLQVRSYEDREGIKRIAAEVVAREVRFLDSRKDSYTGSENNYDAFGDVDLDVKDEDVPF